ncbi:hypothetical protein K502DRAFT_322857 [Neoconidiobolus thromboides FSU 785]|nr:hypothetical protein K502DRAFT_322857 [Neoconidiobolus thromboides FSU 785]
MNLFNIVLVLSSLYNVNSQFHKELQSNRGSENLTNYTITLSHKPVTATAPPAQKVTVTITATEIKTTTEVQAVNQFFTVTLPPIILPPITETKTVISSQISTSYAPGTTSTTTATATVTIKEMVTVTEIKPTTVIVQVKPDVIQINQDIFWAIPGPHPNPLDPNWANSVVMPKPTQ